MNLILVSRIWLFVLAVCFGFSKTWLFDLSGFVPDSGFTLETDLQKNENSLKWILWIRISKTALTNTFLLVTDSKPNQNKTKTELSKTETESGFRFCKSGLRFCD